MIFAYCLESPIDFWAGTLTRNDLLLQLAEFDNGPQLGHDGPDWIDRPIEALKLFDARSRAVLAQIGWEGDVRGEPRYFGIPAEGEFEIGLALKQDNNGTTFVAATQPLDYLERISGEVAVHDGGGVQIIKTWRRP